MIDLDFSCSETCSIFSIFSMENEDINLPKKHFRVIGDESMQMLSYPRLKMCYE